MRKLILSIFLLSLAWTGSAQKNVSPLAPPPGTRINFSHPLAKGLVGSFPMNEGGGQKAFDATGLNFTPGVLTNGAVFQQTQNGNAVFFDSTNDYISPGLPLAGALSRPTTHGTIAAWVYHNLGAGIGNNQGVVSKGDAVTSDRNGYVLRIRAQSKLLLLEVCSASAVALITGSAAVPNNTWTFIVATWSPTTLSTYINGKLDNTAANGSAVASVSNVHQLRIGAENNSSDVVSLFFAGWINNVNIWERCLTGAEVRKLYADPYCMYEYKNLIK